jgi:sugar/nucleoside kinase (ribokinase family)
LILRSIDLLFLNEVEARLLVGIKNPEEAARRALKMGPKIVALKLGKKGCTILTKKGKIHSPAFDVKVVDTTGAGDAFDAGFLASVVKGWDLKKAARFANAVGALSAMKVGARSALPNRKEVKGFLRRWGAGACLNRCKKSSHH